MVQATLHFGGTHGHQLSSAKWGIGSNQSLLALSATIYMSLLGKEGIRQVAELCIQKAHYLAGRIAQLKGWKLAWPDQPFFKEFVVEPPGPPSEVIDNLLEKGILAGIDLGRIEKRHQGRMLIAVTERRTRQQMDSFVEALAGL